MLKTVFFNAQHSPIGAQASFTLGCKGAKGGLAMQLGKPADQSVYIGLENKAGTVEFLPFYEGSEDGARRYTGRASGGSAGFRSFPDKEIRRRYGLGIDEFRAGDLAFRIHTPLFEIPEPGAPKSRLRSTLVPALICELEVDNRKSRAPRKAYFGWNAGRQMRELGSGLRGIAAGREIGLATDSSGARVFQDFGIHGIQAPAPNRLGHVGGLLFQAPPGLISRFALALGFFKDGPVSSGLEGGYFYTSLFEDLEGVLSYALKHAPFYKKEARRSERWLEASPLSADEKFLVSHSTRSYFGSTEILKTSEKKALWLVNEGEYLMMNTFDLTVDHLFFEMRQNPWVVKNSLDLFVERYSYKDQCGLAFTHDMGVNNQFSPPGYSSYERPHIDGCFSYMTHEQLCNWLLTASVYVQGSRDRAWLRKKFPVFQACFRSLLARDDADPGKRNGLMSVDSNRCGRGSEITTYDSLDHSLCPSKGSSYIAMKSWASCLALEKIFREQGREDLALEAFAQARRVADTLIAAYARHGFVPAVLPELQGTGTFYSRGASPPLKVKSRIIPVIEGLIYPYFSGRKEVLDFHGPFADLLRVLKSHVQAALKPGTCLFPDGGWKLSSTSDNSWMSKIALNMFITEKILGLDLGPAKARAQKAHVEWQTRPASAYWAMSDQMSRGDAIGSRYYPRGVTAYLWLDDYK